MAEMPENVVTNSVLIDKSPARMDEFARRLKAFTEYVAAWQGKGTNLDAMIRSDIPQLVKELGELAPARVRQAANVSHVERTKTLSQAIPNGRIDLAALIGRRKETHRVVDGQSEMDLVSKENKTVLDTLSGIILGMRMALYPKNEVSLESRQNHQRNSEQYRYLQSFVNAYDCNDAQQKALNAEFTALCRHARKAQHLIALLTLRDAVSAIVTDAVQDPQALSSLNNRLRDYNQNASALKEFESDAVHRAIEAISSGATNQNVSEAIDTMSAYITRTLNNFEKDMLTAYKEDHRDLKHRKPNALKASTAMLDIVYDTRWAKAADTIYDLIGTHEAALKHTLPLIVTTHQPVASGTVLSGKGR